MENLGDSPICLDRQKQEIDENYIKNGSSEQGWPVLTSSVGLWVDKIFQFPINHVWAVFDLGATWSYFYGTSAHLFRTFWGGFGWGGERLVGSKPYRVFLVITIFAIVGNLYFLIKRKAKLEWKFLFVLGVPTAVLLLMSLFRGAGNWYWYIFTPTARYFSPVIIPLAIFFVHGFVSFLGSLPEKHMQKHLLSFMAVLMSGYNLWAWYSIWQSFYK